MITTILFNYLYPIIRVRLDCGLYIYYCNDMQLSIFFADAEADNLFIMV